MAPQDWEAKAATKRAEVFDRIPKDWQLPEGVREQYHQNSDANVLDVPRTCGILSDAELDITENYDATQLVEKLSSGLLTSLEVTTAFCKRAAIAAQVVR
jgi:amidase